MVSMFVCELIGCRTITFAILCWFSPNFACNWVMWSVRRLLCTRQTGSGFWILEVANFDFSSFSIVVAAFFHRLSQKLNRAKINERLLCTRFFV